MPLPGNSHVPIGAHNIRCLVYRRVRVAQIELSHNGALAEAAIAYVATGRDATPPIHAPTSRRSNTIWPELEHLAGHAVRNVRPQYPQARVGALVRRTSQFEARVDQRRNPPSASTNNR